MNAFSAEHANAAKEFARVSMMSVRVEGGVHYGNVIAPCAKFVEPNAAFRILPIGIVEGSKTRPIRSGRRATQAEVD